jgi:heme-degrading monooxygenase HmoA
MFIAMNNFKVVPGQEAVFEQRWRDRQTYLGDVPGFIEFALLKGDVEGEYISHTVWEDRDAFIAWTKSQSFIDGHRQGGSMQGVLQTHPEAKLYDAVIVERGGVRT